MSENWIEHRRGRDGELLGWMRPVEAGFVAIDLLGRERTGVVDWLDAEETLDELGIGYLADPYELRLDNGDWLRVRLVEVSAGRVRLKEDDGGAVGGPAPSFHTLPLPVPDTLRPVRR